MAAVTGAGRLVGLAMEGARYFGGALGGLVVDWAIWWILWRSGLEPVAAQAGSRAAGAVVSFWLFRRYVFRAGASAPSGQISRFSAAATASWCLSVTLVAGLSAVLPGPVAKFGSDGVTFAVNFLVMKLWVFRPARTNPIGT